MLRDTSGSKREIFPNEDFLQPFTKNPEVFFSLFLYIYLFPSPPVENQ